METQEIKVTTSQDKWVKIYLNNFDFYLSACFVENGHNSYIFNLGQAKCWRDYFYDIQRDAYA